MGQFRKLFLDGSLEEAAYLGELVSKAPGTGPVIEIGTLFGSSTRVLATRKPAMMDLITVDNFCWNPLGIDSKLHFEITSALLSEAIEKLRVRLVNMDKNKYYETYSGPTPSLVFVDAMHSYEETKADLLWARSVGAQIVCGHDHSATTWPGVVRAVKECGGAREVVGSVFVLRP